MTDTNTQHLEDLSDDAYALSHQTMRPGELTSFDEVCVAS